ncbi:MAG: P-loop NTPase fold protein [Planctomycetota bacterium]
MNGNDVNQSSAHLPQNDEPTLEDKLGRSKFITKMANVIRNCTPPQVFGLHGDWGAGKTSAMHQLYGALAGKCPPSNESQEHLIKPADDTTEVVWFEAWRYEHESAPVVALIQEIRRIFPWEHD